MNAVIIVIYHYYIIFGSIAGYISKTNEQFISAHVLFVFYRKEKKVTEITDKEII